MNQFVEYIKSDRFHEFVLDLIERARLTWLECREQDLVHSAVDTTDSVSVVQSYVEARDHRGWGGPPAIG